MKCYDCEKELKKNWYFCPNCKRKLKKHKVEDYVPSEDDNKCHNCSEVLEESWNFCPTCGTAVEFTSSKPSIDVPTMVMTKKDKQTVEKEEPQKEEQVKEEPLKVERKQEKEKKIEKKIQPKADIGFVLIMTLFIVAWPVGVVIADYFFEPAFYIGGFISLFTIIYANYKYPKSIIVNIFFWMFIIYIVLMMLAEIIMLLGLIIN